METTQLGRKPWKPGLEYLWHLFWDKSSPLTRGDYLVALAILWFVDLCAVLVNQFLWSLIVVASRLLIPGYGAQDVSRQMVFDQLFSVFRVGMPWGFILLAGCLLLARRVFPRLPAPLKLLAGLCAFAFFRALAAFPMLESVKQYPFAFAQEGLFDGDYLALAIAAIPLALAGLAFLLAPLFRPAPPLSRPKGIMSPGVYALSFLALSALSIAVTIAIYALELTPLGISLTYSSGGVSPVTVVLALLGIVGLILLALRIVDSGKSLLWLLFFLLPALAFAGYLAATALTASKLAAATLSFLLSLAIDVAFCFQLWLFVAPSGSKRSAAERRAAKPAQAEDGEEYIP